jgi:hypothetical protein
MINASPAPCEQWRGADLFQPLPALRAQLGRRVLQTGFVTLLKIGNRFVGIRKLNHATATTSRHVCIADDC